MSGPRASSPPADDRLVNLGLVLLGAVAILGLLVWAAGETGALIASGEPTGVGAAGAARVIAALPSHIGDPAGAWPESVRGRLPGPFGFWALLAGMVAAAAGGGLAVAAAWRRLHRDRQAWPARAGARGREATGL
ncbi:MAG: hypothetical protein AB1416_06320, partial [Actinomycetota bacterium]